MAHPDFETICNEILGVVQDSSYTSAHVMALVNQERRWIAGEVLLPELATDDEVDTSTSAAYVSLPSDFHRNLEKVYSVTYDRWIPVYGSVGVLHGKFPVIDQSGPVVGAAVRGRNLVYQYIPEEAETLLLWYHRFPTEITGNSDQPTELPEHLAMPLIKNRVLWRLFEKIEEDIDGRKVQTGYYAGLAAGDLADLKRFLGPYDRGYDSFSA